MIDKLFSAKTHHTQETKNLLRKEKQLAKNPANKLTGREEKL
jgi:hypothetical protein